MNKYQDAALSAILLSNANPLEAQSITILADTLSKGPSYINIEVRIDGQDKIFEADWLRRLFEQGGFKFIKT